MVFLGFKKRKVKCHRKDDMSIVGDKYCDTTSKPHGIEFCYTPCPAE